MYATCPISAKIWTRHPLSGGFRLSKNQICCHMLRARVNMPHQGRWHISGDENGNYQLLCSIMESSKQTRSRGVTFQICREAAKNGGREGLTSTFCFQPSPDNLFGFGSTKAVFPKSKEESIIPDVWEKAVVQRANWKENYREKNLPDKENLDGRGRKSTERHISKKRVILVIGNCIFLDFLQKVCQRTQKIADIELSVVPWVASCNQNLICQLALNVLLVRHLLLG